jgi:hypothetical protein
MHSSQQLDGLGRHKCADRTCDCAQNTLIFAVLGCLLSARLREHTAVAWAPRGLSLREWQVPDDELALESNRGAANQDLAVLNACVVEQIPGRGVVRAVEDQVERIEV